MAGESLSREDRAGHRCGLARGYRVRQRAPARATRRAGRGDLDDRPHPRARRRAGGRGNRGVRLRLRPGRIRRRRHPAGRGRGPLRARRHPRQQRRHRTGRRGEPVRRVSLVVRGDVGPGDRDQPEDGVQRDAACLPRHDRARLGQGRARLVSDRAGGLVRGRGSVQRGQGGDGRDDARAGHRGRPARRDRQLDRAGLDRDRLIDARGDRGRPQHAGRAVGHGTRRSRRRLPSCARPARATSPASRSSSTAATRSRSTRARASRARGRVRAPRPGGPC